MSVADFLASADWQDADRVPIAGDASARRYKRLVRGDGSSRILMEDPDGDVFLFSRLARYLAGLGLSAPEIYAGEPGLLLLEDLGDASFAICATRTPGDEATLYKSAIEALALLHRAKPPEGLSTADPATLAAMTDLAFDQYLPGATGETNETRKADTIGALQDALTRHTPETRVTILRDFHAENLIWLPDRSGARRAGLLDFQDALVGHPAYDIVSLIEDARRDVHEETRTSTIRHYLDLTGMTEEAFNAALAVQGAARNLRILGVFARLAATRGKPHYIDLIPRVWGHLMRDLSHPALSSVAPHVTEALPAPTAAHLSRLKAPCPTP
ncbi:Phosphotransferase enzyme family protein [Roseivivax sp. THAF40]|uniref:aminoglycoside phosphotransferase family protein n=1 Tax=Roseivivax sp. THAF40 TaxID=2587858 RepID=UPI0012697483|nr:phosphotransferase [Roseivivax sp. THAF40]QFT48478.1 Phosphotransferase enzyme family protein [Roseivivax sp. THAF40]